jgi:hypothetical protein
MKKRVENGKDRKWFMAGEMTISEAMAFRKKLFGTGYFMPTDFQDLDAALMNGKLEEFLPNVLLSASRSSDGLENTVPNGFYYTTSDPKPGEFFGGPRIVELDSRESIMSNDHHKLNTHNWKTRKMTIMFYKEANPEK